MKHQMRARMCIVAPMIPLAAALMVSAAASQLDRIVGAVAPEGGAFLIKRFSVPPGATIAGVRFASNDKNTAFPRVILLRGPCRSISECALIAETADVTPIGTHRLTVPLQPVRAERWEDLYVAIELPATNGAARFGQGPGILSRQLDATGDSYFASGRAGHFGAMDVEYDMELVFVGAQKADSEQPLAKPSVRMLPNPFNPVVALEFSVPSTMPVRIDIYDAAGRRVRSFPSQVFLPGVHQLRWDGRDNNQRELASGIYLARIRIGGSSFTEKLVLAK